MRSRWRTSSSGASVSTPVPMAGLVGAVMELVTRLPGGDLIVFGLAVAISAGAFAARRWQTRRLLPPQALESAPI